MPRTCGLFSTPRNESATAYYGQLSNLTRKEESLQQSHSIEEAKDLNEIKKGREQDIINDTRKTGK